MPQPIPMIDAHLDLSWNAMSFDRDQTLSVKEIRKNEGNLTGRSRGNNTVSLPEMRHANMGICLATILARWLPDGKSDKRNNPNVGASVSRARQPVVLRENLDFSSQEICSATARGQLAYYRLLERRNELQPITDRKTLKAVWSSWGKAKTAAARAKLPVGYILSMEGGDPILDLDDAEWWWEQGLRTMCLAHYGQSAYAMGTGGDGPLTRRGRELVKKLDKLGMILDLVHTADTALDQALDLFGGAVFVSHGNCRALVPHDRQFSDEQIKKLAKRGGVLGFVLDCWMLQKGWSHASDHNKLVPLTVVADHIDHICQLTGSARHVGIGSDLDGGFGHEETPAGLNTIADLHKLEPILKSRGYTDADVAAIMHGNWLRFFSDALPG